MNRGFSIQRRAALALAAVVLAGSAVQAQSTGQPYPYRATAPQGYQGSRVTDPVPGMSPDTISKAARSSPSNQGGSSSAIGGAYLPPLDARPVPGTGKRIGADNKAHIWLRVPADADIWVDGFKTKQSGESRYFFSPPLTPGRKYSYSVRVRWKKDGKPVEETQRIIVQAGATIRRDLTHSEKSEPRP